MQIPMEVLNITIGLAREAERNKVILEHNLAVNTAFKNPAVFIPGIPRIVNLNNQDFSNATDEELPPQDEHRSCKGCHHSEANGSKFQVGNSVYATNDVFCPGTYKHESWWQLISPCEGCYDLKQAYDIRINYNKEIHKSCEGCVFSNSETDTFEVCGETYTCPNKSVPETTNSESDDYYLAYVPCSTCYDFSKPTAARRNWKERA